MTFITNTPIECTIHPDLWFTETYSLSNISAVSTTNLPPATTKSMSVVSNVIINLLKCKKYLETGFFILRPFAHFYFADISETPGNVSTKLLKKVLHGDSCISIPSLLFLLSISGSPSSCIHRENVCEVISELVSLFVAHIFYN